MKYLETCFYVYHHILYIHFALNVFKMSSVHDVFELVSVVLMSACALCHELCVYACSGRVNQWLKVAGRVYRLSREGNKWSRGFSFVPSLPSYLLYSDGCSQSVQEEAVLVG